MDGVLGQSIGRGRLGTEYHGHRSGRGVPVLDLEILPDGIQGIHLLTLILVQPLDLDIQYAVGINGGSPFLKPLGQHGLVFRLDIQQFFQESAVVLMVQQSFQLPGIPFPIRTDGLRD